MAKAYIFLLVISLSACAGMKDVTKFKSEDVVIGLNKGPCPGKCSVYNLNVYKNKYAVYEGLVNVEKFGLYAKKLSKADFMELTNTFESADFFSFKDEYPNADTNFPTIAMTYCNKKSSKSIKGSIDRPKKILELQRVLEKLAGSDGWTLVKAYEPKITRAADEERAENRDPIIDSQIIIEPGPNVFLAQWLKKYDQYDIQLIKKMSEEFNYWLITFNKQKISALDMMDILKKDTDLKFAEFNKKISPREH
jgi:hypothetical protein